MLDFITGFIGTLLYPLFSIVFVLLDTLQNLFNSLAGIGNVRVTGNGGFLSGEITAGNSGEANDTGLVFYILNTPLIKNMLISMMVLGIFLLIIFTVMAFLKNVYASRPKGWKEIIGGSIKGLANFILLPVFTLLGVWLGNILLNAINGATSSGGSVMMSRKLFIACAYNANIYRNDNGNLSKAQGNIQGFLEVYDMSELFEVKAYNEFSNDTDAAIYYADLIDRIYSEGDGFGGVGTGVPLYSHTSVGPGVTKGAGYYNLYQINYLMLIVGGVFMMYVLISITYGMVKRLFYLAMLFIISPALCSLYPLDEGKAVGGWKDDVKKNVISAYAPVAGLNLFFSLMPLIDNINFMPLSSNAGDSIIDSIIQLIILVCGLFIVKDLMGTIAGYIGGGNAFSDGSSMRSTAKTTIKDKLSTASKKTGAFLGTARNVAHVTRLDKLPGAIKSGIDRKRAGIDDKEIWKGMSAEDRLSALDLAKSSKLASKKEAFALKKDREAFESGEPQYFQKSMKGKTWDELTDQEKNFVRNKRVKAGNYADKDDMIDKEYDGRTSAKISDAIGNKLSGLGSKVGKAANWIGTNAGTKLFLEETGINNIIEEGKKSYTSKTKAQDKRDKAETEGEVGELKAKEKAKKALEKADSGVYITGMTSEVLTALGENISDATFKASKKNLDFESLGLSKDSSLADLRAVDSSLKSTGRGISNIEKAAGNEELAGKFIKAMEEKLLDMDTSGNEKLANSVADAIGKISAYDKAGEKTEEATKKLAEDLKQSFAAMNEASEKNAKEMVKAIETQQQQVVKAVKDAKS